MTPRLNVLILCLLLIVGIPLYWQFYESGPGDARPKDISIDRLRTLSAEIRGSRPDSIEYEDIAYFDRSRNLVAAGQGLREFHLYILSYKLDFPDRNPILVGSGMTQVQAEMENYSKYRFSAQAQVNSVLEKAEHVVPLDDSPGQIGGLEELAAFDKSRELRKGLANQWDRDLGGEPYALAPGVVIIPAAEFQDHRRLVYVHLASGREYLFAGSIAPIYQSWRDLSAPARMVTDRMEPGRREHLYSWLMTLRELKRQAPELTIVSGYRAPAKSGIIRQFTHDYDR